MNEPLPPAPRPRCRCIVTPDLAVPAAEAPKQAAHIDGRRLTGDYFIDAGIPDEDFLRGGDRHA